MSTKDPKPEIMRLEELALLVKAGDIKLPRFQRPFVWKQSDMLKLLDSIYKGYPIGSILIWNSSQPLTSERSIAGLEVDEDRKGWFPTNYLLDGQQRLTTLCGALFWKGGQEGSIWDIHFDLESEEFLYPKDVNVVNLFPLNKLINTGDFIRQCMKFEHHPKKERYLKIAERLLRVIKDYKIAVVKIGDMTIEEVAPIFERINSTGRKLTIVDLMMAATWSNGFDLTVTIREIKEKAKTEGFDDINDQIVLRSISASAELGINKEDIQRLRQKAPEELLRAASVAGNGLLEAIKFLRSKVTLHDLAYLPYGLALTHLAEFFRICQGPSQAQLEEVRNWFWYTSVTGYFSGANTGQNSKDLALIRSFAHGRTTSLFERGEIDISRLLFDRFNLRNASSTTFALLLNQKRPQKSIDGRTLDEAYLKLKSSRLYGSLAPAPFDKYNISKVIHPFSDGPSIPAELQIDLDEHILDVKCFDAITAGNVNYYMTARASLICNLVGQLTSCNVVCNLPHDFVSPYEDSEQPDEADLASDNE